MQVLKVFLKSVIRAVWIYGRAFGTAISHMIDAIALMVFVGLPLFGYVHHDKKMIVNGLLIGFILSPYGIRKMIALMLEKYRQDREIKQLRDEKRNFD